MTLKNALWVQKYKPTCFEELIFKDKSKIDSIISNIDSIPNMLLYSTAVGTGKTTTARLIANKLECDIKEINSSLDRGIDAIRDIVKSYAENMSISTRCPKRMIFLDEADGITGDAQKALRNTMEEYSNNVFFVLTCNNIYSIIPALQSRCQLFDFSNPPKKEIFIRLENICRMEGVEYDVEDLWNLVEKEYPDIRSMIKTLQYIKITNTSLDSINITNKNEEFLKSLYLEDIQEIYSKSYGDFDILGFSRWLARYLFDRYDSFSNKESIKNIVRYIADIEKSVGTGCYLPPIFISNIFSIIGELKNAV